MLVDMPRVGDRVRTRYSKQTLMYLYREGFQEEADDLDDIEVTVVRVWSYESEDGYGLEVKTDDGFYFTIDGGDVVGVSS